MKRPTLKLAKMTAGIGLASLLILSGAQAANITWGANGTFADNTVLALAGPAAVEVYGVDSGGSGPQTTANGYTLADYVTSGNASITGGPSSNNNFLGGGGSKGDGALDLVVNYGLYGPTMPRTLNNLTEHRQAGWHRVVLERHSGWRFHPGQLFTAPTAMI
jgi:hypothetical protein